jgi:hypothetical protein
MAERKWGGEPPQLAAGGFAPRVTRKCRAMGGPPKAGGAASSRHPPVRHARGPGGAIEPHKSAAPALRGPSILWAGRAEQAKRAEAARSMGGEAPHAKRSAAPSL